MARACPVGTVFNRRLEQCVSVRGELFGASKAVRCVPRIADWDHYAAGTSCPSEVRGRSVNSYGYTARTGNYKINPVCDRRGLARIHGYSLTFENVKGLQTGRGGLHQPIVDKSGKTGSDFDFHRPRFRSAAEAAVAARAHCALLQAAGLAGTRRRRRA